MHDSKIVMKSGEVQVSPIYMWRPAEGWLQLFDHDPVRLSDVESGFIGGAGLRIDGRGESASILELARDQGWDGK